MYGPGNPHNRSAPWVRRLRRPMSLKIRQTRPHEGLRLRALRLHALADAPTAFGSTLAREEAFPEHVWHERAANGAAGGDNVTFIAEQDERWVGMAIGLADIRAGAGWHVC